MTNVIDVLKERGFIDAMTSEELRTRANKPMRVYCGFDPTAESLHLGNLVALMGLAWFQRYGHTPVAIVGGATGMIGDPSGKSHERPMLDEETLQKNLKGISKNLTATLCYGSGTNDTVLLNNFDWYKDFSFVEFLRDVGRYFRMGPMLAKDSVKTRLQSDDGMSFTEFTYQVLQGYDFLYLYDNHQVELQIGGQDQWGNITAGTDLIRKVRGQSAHGLTFPLLTRSDGKKFGKSEKGAIWLSPEHLSPYEFYQYLFRMPDADVIRLMRMLTFMEMDEISKYEEMMQQSDYAPNTAQSKLAEEVTRIVHGDQGLKIALTVTKGVAPGSDTALSAETLEALAQDMPSCNLKHSEVVNAKLIDLLVIIGLQASKGQAKRLIENGGAYVNNQQITNLEYSIEQETLIENRLLLLSVGKKNKMLVRVE
ncbi:MAG: tyrosine--tRNA ligase [Chlamydiales bacterium]|nr:tyrosine--tRNA ligase [Chlamydiales bacterium]